MFASGKFLYMGLVQCLLYRLLAHQPLNTGWLCIPIIRVILFTNALNGDRRDATYTWKA